MRKRSGIILVSLGLLALIVVLIWNASEPAQPVLEFQGYFTSGTNHDRFAKVVLHNTTKGDLWMFLGAELKREEGEPTASAQFYSSRINFVSTRERVSPGKSFSMQFALPAGKPAKQVGIIYYTGNFKNSAEFAASIVDPAFPAHANLMTKTRLLLKKIKFRCLGAKPHQLWCPEWLSFAAAESTDPVIKSSQTPAR